MTEELTVETGNGGGGAAATLGGEAPPLPLCDSMIAAAIRSASEAPFRGSIPEFIKAMPMARSYANDGKPFDIESAYYLKPVFEAIQNPDVPVVACLAAVQMLKTFSCVEAAGAYFIANDPGDMTLYIGGDDTSRDQARSRTLPWWWSIPEIGAMFEATQKEDRWDITTQEFYLPNQVIRIWGLNEGTTARITLKRVIGSDIYLSKNTGLWLQAMARTTQHKERKIIGESQGGEEGDDMDKFWHTTDMGYIAVICPQCGTGQTFDFHKQRPDDFKAVLPKRTVWEIVKKHCGPMGLAGNYLKAQEWGAQPPSAAGSGASPEQIPARAPEFTPGAGVVQELEAARAALTTQLLAEDRRHAGFQRGPDELIKRPDGSYNEAEILKQTYYECYHCGSAWHDTPSTRKQLDLSSYYVPSNPNALPGYMGFSWPSWAGQRLRWGGEEVMLGYLRAKKVQETRGDVEPLKQWYQKRAGRPWNPNIAKQISVRRRDAYDVGMAKHDAWRLCMIVDNQLDLMTQWVMVLAVKKNGNVKQLWRGALHGLDEVRKKQLEYLSAEGKPLIKDQFVFLDGRHKGENICRHIVEKKYGHWATMDGERVWLAWNLMMGSPYEYFTHADEKDRSRKFVCGDWTIRNFTLDGNHVEIWSYPFSATMCGQRFEGLRDLAVVPPEEPPVSFLERLADEPADDHELSHHSQIYSNNLVASKSYAPRMAKMHYVPQPASAPDHYFHMWRMMMAVLEIWGVDGVAASPPEKQKVES